MVNILHRISSPLLGFFPTYVSIQFIREVWNASGVVNREDEGRCLDGNAFECLQGFDRLVDLAWVGVVLRERSAGRFSDCCDSVAGCKLGGMRAVDFRPATKNLESADCWEK